MPSRPALLASADDGSSPGAYDYRRKARGAYAKADARSARALARLLFAKTEAESPRAFELPPELSFESPSPKRSSARSWLFMAMRGVAVALLAAHISYIAVTSMLIIVYSRVDPSATVLMAYRSWAFGWPLSSPIPIGLEKLPKWLKSMLVRIEDGKFYDHLGLDFEAIKRARELNARVGRPLYGGSTLTMQVARSLFLIPEKSYLRKWLEAIAALELELFLSKDRILELYFGYAEWGRGVFGIEAASRTYFKKSAATLSRDEGARLVALLSSPIRYGPGTVERNRIMRARYALLRERYVEEPRRVAALPATKPVAAASEAAARDMVASDAAENATAPPLAPDSEAAGFESSPSSTEANATIAANAAEAREAPPEPDEAALTP